MPPFCGGTPKITGSSWKVSAYSLAGWWKKTNVGRDRWARRSLASHAFWAASVRSPVLEPITESSITKW